jgi:hypothetical protein
MLILARMRLVGLVSYRLANTWPVFPRESWEFLYGHPIDPRSAVISLHLLPGFAEILCRKHSLHQILPQGWVNDRTPQRRCRTRACLRRVGHSSSLSSRFSPSLSALGADRKLL